MNKYQPFSRFEKQMKRIGFILEIEEGIDLDLIKSRFAPHNVSQILYFGSKKVKEILPGVQVEYCKKNFDLCVELCKIDGNFMDEKNKTGLNISLFNQYLKKIKTLNKGEKLNLFSREKKNLKSWILMEILLKPFTFLWLRRISMLFIKIGFTI